MSQSEHAHNYEYLNAMSTEQLRELLLLEIESDQDHDELVLHILEVIQGRKKEDDPRQISWQQARAEFDKYYNTPDGKGQQLYPMEAGQSEVSLKKKKPGKIIRFVATAAAVLAVVFLTVPPVFGYSDVWDMVARWTDDLLQLKQILSTEDVAPTIQLETELEYSSLQDALNAYGIAVPLTPQRYPIGYIHENTTVQRRPSTGEIVFYETLRNENQEPLILTITKRVSIDSRTYEKDTDYVETYTVAGIEHTIFSNNNVLAALWTNNEFECSLCASVSLEEIISTIDSIYEGRE